MEITRAELAERARLNALSVPTAMPVTPVAEAIIRRLWIRMAEIFGHRWTSAYGENAAVGAGLTWARGLAGLDSTQVGDGIERMLVTGEDWPPTLPEFRRLCMGVPSLAAVALELRDRDVEHSPFVRLVWSKLDGFAYGRADIAHAERMLRDAYALAREHVLAGGDLPQPSNYLEHAKDRPAHATPERVQEHLREINATLNRMPDHREQDPPAMEADHARA